MQVRLGALDRVRGLAVALMVLDHVLAMTGVWGSVRYSVTRAALPLFGIVAGRVSRGRDASWRQLGRVGIAAVVASWLVSFLPFMARVDVLVTVLLALVVWPAARRWPVPALLTCIALLVTVPFVWDGYHPLFFLACMLVGCGWESWTWAERLPGFLEGVGRWPLAWYCGHLAVLAVWVNL